MKNINKNKLIILFISLFASVNVLAQKKTDFPTDLDGFNKTFETFMNAGKRTDAKELSKRTLLNIENALINQANIAALAETCNLMQSRKMRVYPYFIDYFNVINTIAEKNISETKFEKWHQITDSIISKSKGGHQNYKAYINFSQQLFEQNGLYQSKVKNWRIESNNFNFENDSNYLAVNFDKGIIYGESKTDTVIIQNVVGKYFPFQFLFKADSAFVNWQKVGIPATRTFAVLDSFEINIKNGEYTAENVTFYFKDYFKTKLKGKLKDRLIIGKQGLGTFPKFYSYDKNITLKNIAPNVIYNGAFALEGNTIIGYGDKTQPANINFLYNDTTRVKLKSERFKITNLEKIDCNSAELFMYFDEDSIYHPGINVFYDINKKSLRLLRGNKGISKTPFSDSYHNIEFYVESMYWNSDSNYVTLKQANALSKQNKASFESKDYFDKRRIGQFDNFTSYSMIQELQNLATGSPDNIVKGEDYAASLGGFKLGNIITSIYKMVEEGFIFYDKETDEIFVKERLKSYALASKGKRDYDVIRFESDNNKANARIDFKNKDLDVSGVKEVNISDVAKVKILPRLNFLNIKQDRDFEFNGTVLGGMIDLVGNENKFDYEEFKVEMPKVDWMQLNFAENKDVFYKGGQTDLKPIATRIEGFNGQLFIDAPDNKNGKKGYKDFPKLESNSKAKAHYDVGKFKNVYARDSFYFELDKFTLDSCALLDENNLAFEGTLFSSGIFSPFQETISVQPDLSLGFVTEERNTPLFKGRGNLVGIVSLSNAGLTAEGDFNALTANFIADTIELYPDSLRASCTAFDVAKSNKYAAAFCNNNISTRWHPYKDTLMINMQTEPISVFDIECELNGNMYLSNRAMWAKGVLDWDEATLKSPKFKFDANTAKTKQSSIQIKTIDSTAVAFSVPNVAADVDFENMNGSFKVNGNAKADLPYNKFTADMTEFYWDMFLGFIDLTAPDKDFITFTSTKNKSGNLKVRAEVGLYNLNDYQLDITGVEDISVADAYIIPDSAAITVLPNGIIEPLFNATIIADTTNQLHTITNVECNIKNGTDFLASGDYNYQSPNLELQTIHFSKIEPKKIETENDKKQTNGFYTLGTTKIPETQKFKLDKIIDFKGGTTLDSRNPFLTFDGFAKINIQSPKLNPEYFKFKSLINPENIQIKIENLKGENEEDLYVGIFQNRSTKDIYANFVNPKKTLEDHTFMKTAGFINYDVTSGIFTIGPEAKFKEESLVGDVFKLDDNSNIIKTEGKINLGNQFGKYVNVDCAGEMEVFLNGNDFNINDAIIGLNFLVEKDLLSKMSLIVQDENDDSDEPDYLSEIFKKSIVEFTKPKDAQEALNKLERLEYYTKSPEIDFEIMLAKVNLTYNKSSRSFTSKDPFAIVYVEDRYVNRMFNGYVEFGTRNESDFFNLYFETDNEDEPTWYYYGYKNNVLKTVSSDESYNNYIARIKPKKRRKKTDEKGVFYEYRLADFRSKINFVSRLKED